MSKDPYTILSSKTHFDISEKIKWGQNVTFGPNCRSIRIGYGTFIGNDLYIDVENLEIGEYVTIHHGSVIHGKNCSIGHNCWFGQYCIIDSLGGALRIENNVGVGAHSQLWTHMKFGDRLDGCRWYTEGSMNIGHDVWFVGHCIVASINVEPRSMLLVGGVATHDMKKNHIYAGTPAKDVTERMGYQFKSISDSEKEKLFNNYIIEYQKLGNDTKFIKVIDISEELDGSDQFTYFDLKYREYMPRYTEEEYAFMRFLLYDKAKFAPISRKEFK